MNKHSRFDFQKLQQPQKLDNGFLKVPVFATRSGVFKYVKPDGTIVREFRPPDEVFNEDSMESLKGVPLTNRHPVGLVDSKNAKKFMVGFTSDVVDKHGDMVSSSVTVTDEKTIDEIENDGLREVSCGYICDLELTPGKTDQGEAFDAVQRNIKYNHLAVVDRGRAGPDVRLRMDANSAILEIDENDNGNKNKKPFKSNDAKSNNKGESMAKITLNGAEHEVDSGLATAINTALKDAKKEGNDKAFELFKKKKKGDDDTLQASIDEKQAKIDSLETELKTANESKMDAKAIHEAAQKRSELVATAGLVLDAEEIKADMTNDEIKKAVVLKKTDLKADDERLKSEVYVGARFDMISESLEVEKADGNKNLKKVLSENAGKKDGDGELTADEIRTNNMKTDSEAWEKPIGFHLQ